jgi:hypothetical protein
VSTFLEKPFNRFVLLLGLTFLFFYPSLIHPYLDIDELIWGEMANTISAGCPPYTCIVGEKMPLLYLVMAGVFKFFGKNQYGILHLLHLFWIAGTGYLLTRIPEKTSWLPGLFYILLLALPGFRNLSLTGESLMNPFLILSWGLFLKSYPRPNLRQGLWIGALVGIATLFRHQAGIQLGVYGTALLLPLGKGQGFRSKTAMILGLALGFLGILGAIALILYGWGAWESFYRWAILYNFFYISSGGGTWGSLLEGLKNLGIFFGTTSFFWLLAMVALWRFRKKHDLLILSSLLYLLFALVAAAPGLRFYPHYFIQCYPPLVYLAWRGWQTMTRLSWLKKTGLALCCLGVLLPHFFLEKILQDIKSKDYAEVNHVVGQYIREHSREVDKVFIWGWGHGIYYFAGRGMGMRLMHSDPLSGRLSASDPTSYSLEEARTRVPGEYWKLFLTDMEGNKPLYLVDTSPANIHDYGYFPLEAYPVLKQYVQDHYRLETTLDGVKLYRRLDLR